MRLIVGVLALSALACATAAAASARGHITGRVLDDASGVPVADARVTLVGANVQAVSDARGCFTLVAPSGGRWPLRVSREGFVASVIDAEAHDAPGTSRDPAAGNAPDCSADATISVHLHGSPLRASEHVIVTPGRREQPSPETPRSTSVINRADLDERAPRTTPDAIADAAGVFLQKTNHGSGAPYVRGLIGNHVLLLIDGVRLSNATYRYGPNQYLATVDPSAVSRIEIVRGPGSVLFGSDAIGGVVNVITTQPALSPDGVRASIGIDSKVVSSGMERWGRIAATVRGPRAAMRAGMTLQSFGDLVAGGALGVERPSAYDHVAADASVVVQMAPRHVVTASYQFDHQDDVPRWDQVAQRGYERYSFSPQWRQMGSARWKYAPGGEWLESIATTVSHQRTREGRDIHRRGSATSSFEDDRVRSLGFSADASGRFGARWTWVTGTEWYHDRVRSRRDDTTMATGSVAPRRGLYPDGATAWTVAAFGRTSVAHGAWQLEGGTRATRFHVEASDQAFSGVGLDRAAVIGDAGGTLQVVPRLQVVAHVAQSFRAPNIDDLSSLGRFDFGVEVPSPDLEPERAVSIETGLRLSGTRAAARLVAYRTGLRDLIDRVRSTYEGAPTWDGQDVYRKANVGQAVVRGFEAEGEWRPSGRLSLLAHATYTHGHNTTRNEPMRRIPPFNGLVRASYRRGPRWYDASLRWAARQDRLSSGDIDDHRIRDDGTPGWAALDVSAGHTLRPGVRLSGGVSNVFDAAYRTHGSGIDGAGRSLWVAVGATLSR